MIPPLAMSTGFLMFLYEPTRPSAFHVGEALLVGLLFSAVLIYTSKFERRDGDIYLKRSKAFAYILAVLLIIRVVLRLIVGQDINPAELSGMFFLLAFGMLLLGEWRCLFVISNYDALLMMYLQLFRCLNSIFCKVSV
ncbi:cytochrome c biogenesis protein CcdC [Bacillus sp. JCM 19041]|uniref:CcdC family protein n=1 Tax=Bacillus sp. JCM 19041 TaxID=1460637 RepID=UPI000A77CE09